MIYILILPDGHSGRMAKEALDLARTARINVGDGRRVPHSVGQFDIHRPHEDTVVVRPAKGAAP